MLLAFNTLKEASDHLHRETGKNWTPRQIIQTCLDYGIFPHVQILTDREDLPIWMREGGAAELPFNIDLLSFLSGTGVIHMVRRDDIHYKIEPGLRCDLSDIRLTKDALNQLLAQHKQCNGDLYEQPKQDIGTEPWLEPDPKDPKPAQGWYTPARYFARQLVREDSTLLTKRDLLAQKVAKSLEAAGFLKRGGIKPLDPSTVKKAFSKVTLG